MNRIELMETVFKALADQTRLRILGLLGAGEVCVCEIHESLRIPQPTASRHLAYLKRAGLVADRRDGLWVYYRLARPRDAVLRTVPGTFWEREKGIDDRGYIVPGAGGLGEVINNSWV